MCSDDRTSGVALSCGSYLRQSTTNLNQPILYIRRLHRWYAGVARLDQLAPSLMLKSDGPDGQVWEISYPDGTLSSPYLDALGAVKLIKAWAEMRCAYAATRSCALPALLLSGLVKVRAGERAV